MEYLIPYGIENDVEVTYSLTSYTPEDLNRVLIIPDGTSFAEFCAAQFITGYELCGTRVKIYKLPKVDPESVGELSLLCQTKGKVVIDVDSFSLIRNQAKEQGFGDAASNYSNLALCNGLVLRWHNQSHKYICEMDPKAAKRILTNRTRAKNNQGKPRKKPEIFRCSMLSVYGHELYHYVWEKYKMHHIRSSCFGTHAYPGFNGKNAWQDSLYCINELHQFYKHNKLKWQPMLKKAMKKHPNAVALAAKLLDRWKNTKLNEYDKRCDHMADLIKKMKQVSKKG